MLSGGGGLSRHSSYTRESADSGVGGAHVGAGGEKGGVGLVGGGSLSRHGSYGGVTSPSKLPASVPLLTAGIIIIIVILLIIDIVVIIIIIIIIIVVSSFCAPYPMKVTYDKNLYTATFEAHFTVTLVYVFPWVNEGQP
jgi:hypothetical protein